MSFDFATAAVALDAYLTAQLPEEWRVQDAEKPLGATSGIVLTYAQGNLDVDLVGTTMPNGFLAVDFALVLSAPETDATKGLPRLNAAAVQLFRALDAHEAIRWVGAERAVLQTGETIYIIPAQVITTYNTPE